MSKLDPDQRRRMVNEALKAAYGEKRKTQADIAYEKAKDITEAVRNFIKPILKAGGWKDTEALRTTVCRMYLEAFDRLTKEELLLLIAGMHVEIIMEQIQASPWGDDKPDILSGK